MKILTHYVNTKDGSHFYRGAPISELHRSGIYAEQIKGADWDIFSSASVFFLQRPFHKQHLEAIIMAKAMNRKVIIDYDDLLTYLPNHLSFLKELKKKFNINKDDIQDTVKSCIEYADLVFVSTEYLKEKWESINNNIIVVPNSFNDYVFNLHDRYNEESNLIFWRGTDSHEKDLDEYAFSIAKSINSSNFDFIGMGYDYRHFNKSIRKYNFQAPNLNVLGYLNNLIVFEPSILIVPLQYTQFNQAKSACAAIEAHLAGACALVPRMKEWEGMGYQYEDHNDFEQKLNDLINNPELRKKIFIKTYKTILEKRLLSVNNLIRAKEIKKLIN